MPAVAAVGKWRVAPASGTDWRSSPRAAEAWLIWATDWFLDASSARKGSRLVGEPGGWPYINRGLYNTTHEESKWP